jgi:hypothetical protein
MDLRDRCVHLIDNHQQPIAGRDPLPAMRDRVALVRRNGTSVERYC